MSQLQSVRGTKDILGKDALLKEHFLKTFFDYAKRFGYSYIETPIFEYTSVFKRTLGETSDIVGKEMYTFEDRGGDSLTLRPEGTAPCVRALIENGLTQTLPQKFFYQGPMFRYERPQKGRSRQFHQACVEYIGVASPLADVEVISLAANLLKALDINDVVLHINTLGDTDSRLAYRDALVHYFTPFKGDLSKDSLERLLKNPLRILDSKDAKDQEIVYNAPLFEQYLNDSSKAFYQSVLKGLDALKIDYVKQQTLVRGLDYYTHTAFEFKTTSLGAQDTVLAGGRYDHLVSQMGGGVDIPAIGFGMGIERACLLMDNTHIKQKAIFGIIPIGESDFENGLILAQRLRHEGLNIEMPLQGNLGKRFKQLERIGGGYAIVFGSNEWEKNTVTLKNLKTQDPSLKEISIDIQNLSHYLKNIEKTK
ncbi:MAG: histidine--tRNA ligase [Proteobacteria bacterium]|nr:histidine--tRNA ligase [Pseudomonadota bacterium]